MDKKIEELIQTYQEDNLELAEQLLIGQGYKEESAKKLVYNIDLFLFLRLCSNLIFQKMLTALPGHQVDYDYNMFKLPYIRCIDGFGLSIQISNGHYCESENGYRRNGLDWKEVEIGAVYGDDDIINKELQGEYVARVSVDIVQDCINRHGGINWIKTLSKENIENCLLK